MDIQGISYTGIQVGIGVAVIPTAVTTFIASSKIIFINMIWNTTVRILTANAYRGYVTGVSFVAVPLLWKISLIAAITGGTIVALSLLAAFVDSIYQRKSLAL